jgi:hypothetical protein
MTAVVDARVFLLIEDCASRGTLDYVYAAGLPVSPAQPAGDVSAACQPRSPHHDGAPRVRARGRREPWMGEA